MQAPINKIRIYLLALLLGCGCIVQAQTKWELLEPTLSDSTETAKLGFYISAAKNLFVSNKKLAELYARKGFEIASSNPEYQYQQGDLYNLLGVLTMYNKQYAEAEKYYQNSIAIARQLNNEPLEIKARTNIALNSSNRGDFQKAVAQNFELLRVIESKQDLVMLSNVYANLSNAYYFLKQLKPAETYQLKALAIFKQTNARTGIANALNSLGTIYTDQKKLSTATTYLQQSLAIKKQLGDSLGMANTYTNLASLYKELKNNAEELNATRNAERLFTALKDDEKLASTYLNYGNYYSRQNNWAKALSYEKKAIALAEKESNPYILSNAYESMSATYAHLNNPDTALAFSNKALSAKDSMYDEGMRNQVAEVQVKYETLQKEQQIKEQELLLQQKENSLIRRNYGLAAVAGLLLAGSIFTYLFYKRAKLKQALQMQDEIIKQQDMAASAVMAAEENERARIARELHDGIGQMMSVAKMNLSAIETNIHLNDSEKIQFEKAISLVDESCKEVRMVAHTMMPNTLLKAGLASAIRNFINNIDNRVIKISFASEGINERLDYKIETVLYRVVQEAVTNVIKHSGANELDISLIRDDDGLSATIEDNGKGFDTTLAGNGEGIGLKNIVTRMAFLKGTAEWNSSPGNGTLLALHIPV